MDVSSIGTSLALYFLAVNYPRHKFLQTEIMENNPYYSFLYLFFRHMDLESNSYYLAG